MLEFNSIATLGAARNLLSGSIKKTPHSRRRTKSEVLHWRKKTSTLASGTTVGRSEAIPSEPQNCRFISSKAKNPLYSGSNKINVSPDEVRVA